jgi:hypothetical protein
MSSTNRIPATGHTRRIAGKHAASRARQNNLLTLTLPGIGPLTLPPPDQLADLAGIAVLTAVEIIEWPVVAIALAAGHLLADQRRNKAFHDFGQALEEA